MNIYFRQPYQNFYSSLQSSSVGKAYYCGGVFYIQSFSTMVFSALKFSSTQQPKT
jgi:hypothetical protein